MTQHHKSAKRGLHCTLQSASWMAPLNGIQGKELIRHAGISWSVAVVGCGGRGG